MIDSRLNTSRIGPGRGAIRNLTDASPTNRDRVRDVILLEVASINI